MRYRKFAPGVCYGLWTCDLWIVCRRLDCWRLCSSLLSCHWWCNTWKRVKGRCTRHLTGFSYVSSTVKYGPWSCSYICYLPAFRIIVGCGPANGLNSLCYVDVRPTEVQIHRIGPFRGIPFVRQPLSWQASAMNWFSSDDSYRQPTTANLTLGKVQLIAVAMLQQHHLFLISCPHQHFLRKYSFLHVR